MIKLPLKKWNNKFPKNYLTITDVSFIPHKFSRPHLSKSTLVRRQREIVAAALSVLVIGAIIFISFDIKKTQEELERVERQKQKLSSEIVFWEKTLITHPGYRDGYFQLALLEYQVKDFEKAKIYTQKALDLDPNFEKGRELERILK